jgi:hypothetical protein
MLQQYNPGDFLVVRRLNWDEIIDQDDDDENWADPRSLSRGRSRPGDRNGNVNAKGEEDTQGGENGTAQGKGTKDGKGKGKGKGKGNGKRRGIYKQTTVGDDIFFVIALQLQNEMNEADLGTEG